jgi:hypothetical protein
MLKVHECGVAFLGDVVENLGPIVAILEAC